MDSSLLSEEVSWFLFCDVLALIVLFFLDDSTSFADLNFLDN
jgi:hypothetical protein